MLCHSQSGNRMAHPHVECLRDLRLSVKETKWQDTYHYSSKQTDSFPTVCVWYHVAIPDGEKSYWYQPHRSEEVAGNILLIVVPEKQQTEPVLFNSSTERLPDPIQEMRWVASTNWSTWKASNLTIRCKYNRGSTWAIWQMSGSSPTLKIVWKRNSKKINK